MRADFLHRATTSTVIVLLWLWLWGSGFSSGLLQCGSCEGGDSLTCPGSTAAEFFTLSLLHHANEPDSFVSIKCYVNTTAFDFSLLDGCNFSAVHHVKFSLCPLWNESFGNVLHKVGVIPGKVRSLSVSYAGENEIAELQPWHLQGLPNLTFLQLSENNFTSIPDEFFLPTPSLQTLYLNGNNFSSLPQDLFAYTPDIRFINLGNNGIRYLPVLSNLTKLLHLHFWNNEVREIPVTLFKDVSELLSFDISGNYISELNAAVFENLTKLETLSLANNFLESFPDDIFDNCLNLTTLRINHNRIRVLPEGLFKKSKNLKYLFTQSNRLSEIPESLFENTGLQNITLRRNQLGSLPENVLSNLRNLEHLDLQSNFIKNLSSTVFANMFKLKILLLNNNTLGELPSAAFKNCESLKRLYLQDNNLLTIPSDALPFRSVLEKLNISNNRLMDLDELINPFNRQSELEEVYLSKNNLTIISQFFSMIPIKLKLLDISSNKITYLSESELIFLSSNVTVDVRNNHIETIFFSQSLHIFASGKTVNLYLSGNQLRCNCSMHPFISFFREMDEPAIHQGSGFHINLEDASDVFCTYPRSNETEKVLDADLSRLTCRYPVCVEGCSCIFRIHDRMLLMDCSSQALMHVPEIPLEFRLVQQKIGLTLNLDNNRISNLSLADRPGLQTLAHISLVNNSLNYLDNVSFVDSLKYVDLRGNRFTSLTQDAVRYLNSSNISLSLSNNPWKCDCQLTFLFELIFDKYKQIQDLERIQCVGADVPLEDMKKEQFCPFFLQPVVISTIIVVSIVLLAITILGTAGFYKYREGIKVWLFTHRFCLWAITEDEIDANKIYDAFISFSHKDEEFVNNFLLPGLESGDPKYRICLHYRDWIPGEYIDNQILQSVQSSRRTIIVLSKNFIDSVWGKLEFKAAHSQAMKDQTNRIIVIVYGEVPPDNELDDELKLYISQNTYLKWGDAKFWARLRFAMPHPHDLVKKKCKRKDTDKLELMRANSTATSRQSVLA